ncbi:MULTISPECIES: DHH family phosphoesterase [Bacillus]|uniref:DHH family phosphoesterase n=1 Tax=Bacillus TaxID=1386 RepID=UPI00032DB0AC|nr:hypothetical protein [Bacillus cereus]EOO44237.1 hypothetical protein ICK_06494 [Bacillus cereus BAG1X2-2]EOP00364.1 hypothetical protein ICO_06320 [Bacillus cereus BAG2O-1]
MSKTVDTLKDSESLEMMMAKELAQEKVKVFSHNDLDGVGCGIVALMAHPTADVEYCAYHDINDKVKAFIMTKGYEMYDRIYITDISVNEEVAELIEEHCPTKVRLLDHHGTATWLDDKYFWALVEEKREDGSINSGTNLLFEELQLQGYFKGERYQDALTIFVEMVRRYDSWEWKNIYDDQNPMQLNNLFFLVGINKFVKRYVDRFNTLELFTVREGYWMEMFDETDVAVLTIDNKKKEAYIKRKEKQMIKANLIGYDVGVVFAEQYISELGNELSERNQDLEFIVIIDMGAKKVSYRTIHAHINLGKDVAGFFGGGGHPKASGSMFNERVLTWAYKVIFGLGFIGKFKNIVDRFKK